LVDDVTQADTLDLRDYLAVLRRRRWIVLQTIVIVVAVAMAVTFLQTPRYASETRVVVQPNTGRDDAVTELVLGARELETQKELVVSRPVAELVVQDLELDVEPEDLLADISVSLLRDTQILQIEATSTDPEEAAALAQGFADAYLLFRQDQALQNVLRAQQALESRERDIRDRLQEVERSLRTATGADATALELEQQRLANDLASLATQRANLSGSEVFAAGGGQVIRPAEVPASPVSPKPLRTGILALVLGAMLGVGLAFLRDHLDDAIRSDDQAVRAAGRPVIGHVPRWRSPDGDDDRLVGLVEPASPASEAYRTLRTNLRFLTVGRSFRSVLVTSAVPGEGKTTTAGNLAVALSRTGARVLLVGADLRRPRIHACFGIDSKPGLSDVLIGEVDLVDAVVDVGVPNLRVVPGGNIPPNPAELLGSPTMIAVMEQLEQIADVVVYDGPPVLAVADALEMASVVGAVLLVVDSGSTGRHALTQAIQRLAGVGAKVPGLVLNNLDPQDGYYGYAYYHSYPSEEPAGKRGSKPKAGTPS
jgi:polysaccharide biosynthesis transport protein